MKEKVIRHRAYESLDCPVEVTTEIIGGKWKGKIVYILLSGKKRFGELRRSVGTATHRMLTTQLRQLERHGVVQRTVYLEAPPKVEYSLTRRGQKLKPVIETLWQWEKSCLIKAKTNASESLQTDRVARRVRRALLVAAYAYGELLPHLENVARNRGDELLAAHQRVRSAW